MRQVFLPHDAKQILKIPLGRPHSRDQMIWGKEKSGLFSVKSAYLLAYSVRREVVARAESSKGREENGKMWKQMWNLPVKQKLKHFL